MDVIDFGQVLHAIGDAAQHTQELQNLELAVIGLNGERATTNDDDYIGPAEWKCQTVYTLRKVSSDPFSMYSVMIMTGFDLVTTPCR